MITLDEARNWATVLGVVVGAGSLVIAAFNTRLTLQANRARFWLELRDRFARHDDVHKRLRPGGTWSGQGGPSSPDEWAQIEAYMGLFEHCEIMLDQKLIDEQTFQEIYSYRLENIVANRAVRTEKLGRLAHGWTRFLNLARRMKIDIPHT